MSRLNQESQQLQRWEYVKDLQGGKPGCHFSRENVCPTLTKGRAACSDIHSMCIVED